MELSIKIDNVDEFIVPPAVCPVTTTTETNGILKIKLEDCLLCKSCITTAESILIEKHSNKILKELLANHKGENSYILSISTQSLLSISEFYQSSYESCLKKLKYSLSKLGFLYF